MSREKTSRDDELLEELVDQNREGLEKLAKEEPAKEMRRGKIISAVKKFYRKYFDSKEVEEVSL
ncbi:MAG: hypothetical protein ABEJ99_03350 [Candidatus Nanohaloarchaea archaeon]